MFYYILSAMLHYDIILIAAAVVPAVFLLVKVYRADRIEAESPAILLALLRSGVLAALLALLEERFFSGILQSLVARDSVAYRVLLYFVVVAVSEESSKFIMLRRGSWNSPEFNCQYDGVVYAVFVSLGFAVWEHISYVLSYGISTALLRAVTAVPGHACFGVFMGVWYGLAKRFDLAGDLKSRKTCLALCVILPALIHALYDYIAMTDVTEWVFIVFIAALFYVAFQIIKKASARDYVFYRR